jgi:hypothetical protein
VPNSRRVVFTTNGGIALAYDYFADKWSVWTNHNAVDAALFGGLLTYVQAGGQLWQETPGPVHRQRRAGPDRVHHHMARLRRAVRIPARLAVHDPRRLPQPAQPARRRRLRRQPRAAADEIVNAGTLLGTGSVADTTLADTDNPGGGAFPAYEFTVKCVRQKCSSIQVTVSEGQLGPTYGEGLSISGLTFLVGGLKGLHPVAKTRAI